MAPVCEGGIMNVLFYENDVFFVFFVLFCFFSFQYSGASSKTENTVINLLFFFFFERIFDSKGKEL